VCLRVKVVQPREYNPRFEMDFNAAADYDFDRQRSEARKLQRQMVKEKRGAMRELRRDAAFMAAVSRGTWCREWVWGGVLAAAVAAAAAAAAATVAAAAAVTAVTAQQWSLFTIVLMLVVPAWFVSAQELECIAAQQAGLTRH
jgi:hypothetical protein